MRRGCSRSDGGRQAGQPRAVQRGIFGKEGPRAAVPRPWALRGDLEALLPLRHDAGTVSSPQVGPESRLAGMGRPGSPAYVRCQRGWKGPVQAERLAVWRLGGSARASGRFPPGGCRCCGCRSGCRAWTVTVSVGRLSSAWSFDQRVVTQVT